MGEFEIEVKKVRTSAKEIESIRGELGRSRQQLEGVNLQLAFLKEYRGLGKTISRMIEELDTHQKQVGQYSDGLEQIAKEYQDAENRILGKGAKNIDWEFDKLFNGILGKFGLLGGLASTVNKVIAGWSDGFGADDVLSLMKGVVSATGSIAGFTTDKKWIKFLTGASPKSAWDQMGIKTGDGVICKWKKYVGSKLDDYNFSSATKVGEKVKVAAKWAGSILTAVTTAYGNYKEHGGMTERAWAETIVETGLNIAEGAIIGAAITAAIGSAAPAFVVGVATVVVTWGVDAIYKAISGSEKGIIEDASDVICDWAGSIWNKGKEFLFGGSQKAAFA